MEDKNIDKISLVVWLRNSAIIVAMMLLVAIANHGVAGQDALEDPGGEPEEGQIWNITDAPFTFQLHRAAGSKWTPEITLEPGEFRTVLATETDLLGVSNDPNKDGYVVVRYPALGGHVQVMLSARTRNDQFVPYWFHVKDSNGVSRMIQANSREQAEETQKTLLQQPPMSKQEIEQIKRTLRANWVLYD